MSADLYKRPDRAAIAAKVRGQLPGATPPEDPAVTPREELEAAVRRSMAKWGVSNSARFSGRGPAIADNEFVRDILAIFDARAPQPPRYAGFACEPSCTATDKPGHAEDAYFCTSQEGHAPPHLAHDTDGNIVHAWQDEAS